MSEKIEELAKNAARKFMLSSADVESTIADVVRWLYPLIAAEMAGVVMDPKLADQVSRVLAAGWRGNPNMSGDDRDFMPGPMRRRHDDRTAAACEYIATTILDHSKKIIDGNILGSNSGAC